VVEETLPALEVVLWPDVSRLVSKQYPISSIKARYVQTSTPHLTAVWKFQLCRLELQGGVLRLTIDDISDQLLSVQCIFGTVELYRSVIVSRKVPLCRFPAYLFELLSGNLSKTSRRVRNLSQRSNSSGWNTLLTSNQSPFLYIQLTPSLNVSDLKLLFILSSKS